MSPECRFNAAHVFTLSALTLLGCNQLLSIEAHHTNMQATGGASGLGRGGSDAVSAAGESSAGASGVRSTSVRQGRYGQHLLLTPVENGSASAGGAAAGSAGASAVENTKVSGVMTLVSIASDGLKSGDETSHAPSVSSDGNFVLFKSSASDLVNADWSQGSDPFLRDRASGKTIRANIAMQSLHEFGFSDSPLLSGDGTTIVIASDARTSAGQTPGVSRIFRIYLNSNPPSITLLSHGNTTAWEPAINEDGRTIAYAQGRDESSYGNDVRVTDAQGGTELLSVTASGEPADGDSRSVALNAKGNVAAFASSASNLVGSDTNKLSDIYVRVRGKNPYTERISSGSGSDGESNGDSDKPKLSGDGQHVAYSSAASNLVPEDRNGKFDVFVYDRSTRTTTRVSVSSAGREEGNADSWNPSLSYDGRLVAFESYATNLVAEPFEDAPGTRNIFVHDLKTRQTLRISKPLAGSKALGASFEPAISANGRVVVFTSTASNLVDNDHNEQPDVFAFEFKSAPWL
jgi:Tol biopolymer transport system component